MKYILMLLLVALIGCGKVAKTGGSILTINGCQYAIYNGKDGVAMVHAGNCNNPEHTPNRFSNMQRFIDTSIAENKFFVIGRTALTYDTTNQDFGNE